MKTGALVLMAALISGLPAFAGVVYEVQVTDHTENPQSVTASRISVEGEILKMDVISDSGGLDGEMIFRGDRREMVIVSNEEKSYFVLDEQQMKALADQVNQAVAAMEQALAAVPESQRAKVEQMMKARMPMQMDQREASELKKTGDADTLSGYPCVKYEVWRGGAVEREIWVTPWENIEGGADAAQAFEGMSSFFKEMLESLPQMGQQSFADSALEHLKEMGGIPILTREFATDGSLESEAALTSASRQVLDPADFEPPGDYKRRDIFGDRKGKKK